MLRSFARDFKSARPVSFQVPASKHAEGSCLIALGDTQVLCTASLEEKVPPFLKGSGKGWVTAEYGMLPRSTHTRMDREAARGKQSGRTHEIQRLIGRSLRSVMDFSALGERQIRLDCDVIQADGGTRTAAITGAYVALHLAFQRLIHEGKLSQMPLVGQVAALSCGIVGGQPMLDLDYHEDSQADVDMNVVMARQQGESLCVEIQATAENNLFSRKTLDVLLDMTSAGTALLFEVQREVLKTHGAIGKRVTFD